jgi:hypothetical protein
LPFLGMVRVPRLSRSATVKEIVIEFATVAAAQVWQTMNAQPGLTHRSW